MPKKIVIYPPIIPIMLVLGVDVPKNKIAVNDVTGTPDALKKNLDWYIANQQELAAKYNGKILLIVDQGLVNVFEDITAAYAAAIKSYAPNTFTLQPCSPEADSYTMMFYSPAFGILNEPAREA